MSTHSELLPPTPRCSRLTPAGPAPLVIRVRSSSRTTMRHGGLDVPDRTGHLPQAVVAVTARRRARSSGPDEGTGSVRPPARRCCTGHTPPGGSGPWRSAGPSPRNRRDGPLLTRADRPAAPPAAGWRSSSLRRRRPRPAAGSIRCSSGPCGPRSGKGHVDRAACPGRTRAGTTATSASMSRSSSRWIRPFGSGSSGAAPPTTSRTGPASSEP